MNFKKAQNAYVLTLTLVLVGLLFLALGYTMLTLLSEDGALYFIAKEIVEGGWVVVSIGTVWTVLAFLGSFFEFETGSLRMKVLVIGALVIFSTLMFAMIGSMLGLNMIEQPWLNLFFLFGGVGAFLISSSVFFYAARMRGEDTRFAFGNRVGKMLNNDE